MVRGLAFAAVLAACTACVDLTPPQLRADAGADADAGGDPSETGPDTGGETPTLGGPGDPCQSGAACSSGNCADGVCCDSECRGPCQTCASPGSPGMCVNAVAGTDPRGDCPDDGASTCGHDGTCDGQGQCRLYRAGTTCKPALCVAGMATPASTCDGNSACSQPAAKACAAPFACGPAGACGTSCTADADCLAPRVCGAGACGGLTATYYDNPDFTGTAIHRVDAVVDFDWGSGSPDPALGPDWFAVRWTGTVTALRSESYTFYTISDDGVRLWVNGVLLIDHWDLHNPTEDSGTITLVGGMAYPIKLEYFDGTGEAQVRLSWQSPSQSRQVVPTRQLQP